MKLFNKRYHQPGTVPGKLIEVPKEIAQPLHIRLINYNSKECVIREDVNVVDCAEALLPEIISWVHLQGHPDETSIRALGEIFTLHSLAMEDVLDTGQTPKCEYFDDHIFVVMGMPIINASGQVAIEQVSLFIGRNYLLSFYVGDQKIFNPIVKRLQDQASYLRNKGPEFLLYSLLDLFVDEGFPILEKLSIRLEELENNVLSRPSLQIPEEIYAVRRDLIFLRRLLWPQREVIKYIQQSDHVLIKENVHIYINDCYDHSIQVMELIETYREMISSMLEIYLSSVNVRINRIMGILAMIATIFIPLTFITGVYGMNFDRTVSPWNMPELGWRFGYPFIWLVIITVTITMLLLFRRNKWF